LESAPGERAVMGGVGAAGGGVGIGATAFAGEIPRSERRSGYEFMGRETRAMQDDDTANPGMLWVLEGEALWNRKLGVAGRACSACHADPRASINRAPARPPPFD